jgi:hypothetical protein
MTIIGLLIRVDVLRIRSSLPETAVQECHGSLGRGADVAAKGVAGRIGCIEQRLF